MNLLLVDAAEDRALALTRFLREQGAKVLRLSPGPDLVQTLAQQHLEIDLALLVGNGEELAPLVAELRSQQEMLYLLCLLPNAQDSQDAARLLNAGADLVQKGMEQEELAAALLAAKRILRLIAPPFLAYADNDQAPAPQILDLEIGMAFVNEEGPLFKELLTIMVENARPLSQGMSGVEPTVFEELHQNAESLGAEELARWLKTVLRLKGQLQHFESLRHHSLKEEFDQILDRLIQAIGILEHFSFFAPPVTSVELNLQGAEILLVEDMLHNRVLVKQILKKHNPVITEAKNGLEAVDAWKAHGPFDLIMMDMNMPIMDGFEATSEIRRLEAEQTQKHSPILALTALAMRGDQERCMAAGCDGYIPKPVDTRQLVQVSAQLIADRAASALAIPSSKEILINKVGIATPNQVFRKALALALAEIGIEVALLPDSETLLDKVEAEEFDLVILGADEDLQMAYFIKERFPRQELALINGRGAAQYRLVAGLPHVIPYPFDQAKVREVIEYHSSRLEDHVKYQNLIQDFNALKSVKGQSSATEVSDKSQGQIEVWQKTFRKIGGDLVLSHQFNLHGRFGFILADVSGHDVQSGYTASWFAGLVKGVWPTKGEPIELLRYLNSLFTHDTEEEDKRYVCALVLLWDPLRSRVTYANAGIPGGILTRARGGKVEFINWKGVPVGMFPDLEMFDQGELHLDAGDRLFLATDGVLESIPDEVIANLSREKENQHAKQALEGIVDFILRSMQIKDDLTLAVFEPALPPLATAGYRTSMLSDMTESFHELQRLHNWLLDNGGSDFDWPLISVAIKEALINAVEHGNHNDASLPVDIDAEILEVEGQRCLRVRVSDCGPGFDLKTERQRIEAEGQLRIQGRGIQLMESVAKSLSFFGGGMQMEFAPGETLVVRAR